MASFQDAFQKGLEAYDSAARAKAEIFSVFDDCAKQVGAASGGAIVLSREWVRNPVEEEKATLLSALPSYRSYEALVARMAGEPKSKGEELCEYKLAYHGYPVSLVYADVDEYCHDKQGLERALIHLLGHPTTGGKLRRLMELQAKRVGGGAGSSSQANGNQSGTAE